MRRKCGLPDTGRSPKHFRPVARRSLGRATLNRLNEGQRVRFLSDDELKALTAELEACDERVMLSFVYCAIFSGASAGELLSLEFWRSRGAKSRFNERLQGHFHSSLVGSVRFFCKFWSSKIGAVAGGVRAFLLRSALAWPSSAVPRIRRPPESPT
jgi:hypothetical protein